MPSITCGLVEPPPPPISVFCHVRRNNLE